MRYCWVVGRAGSTRVCTRRKIDPCSGAPAAITPVRCRPAGKVKAPRSHLAATIAWPRSSTIARRPGRAAPTAQPSCGASRRRAWSSDTPSRRAQSSSWSSPMRPTLK